MTERRTTASPVGDWPLNDFKRDGNIVYVSNPDGATVTRGARKGQFRWERYRRCSTLGDIPHPNLVTWQKRHVAHGTTLITPRYQPYDNRQYWDQIVEEAEHASGANTAADIGTHIHRMCAIATIATLNNQPWRHLMEPGPGGITLAAAIRAAAGYLQMLNDLSLQPLAVEAPIVNDSLQAAGTPDVFLREKNIVVVGDIKLAANLKPHYAAQIYGYATGTPYQFATQTRCDWPDHWPAAPYPDVGWLFRCDRDTLIEHEQAIWESHRVYLDEGADLIRRVDAIYNLDPDNYFAHNDTHHTGGEPT